MDKGVWSLGMAGMALVAMVGCGNLTAGGFAGVDVAISGDAPATGGGNESVAVAIAEEVGSAKSLRDDPEGELEAEFTLALISATGAVASLTDMTLRLRMDVGGAQEIDAVSASVSAGRYTALRVVFTDFEIEIDAGLIINGVPVTGNVEVELEDGSLQVDKALALDLADGDQVRLLIDLNAATWLQAVDPDLRRVAEAVVGDAITVIVQ